MAYTTTDWKNDLLRLVSGNDPERWTDAEITQAQKRALFLIRPLGVAVTHSVSLVAGRATVPFHLSRVLQSRLTTASGTSQVAPGATRLTYPNDTATIVEFLSGISGSLRLEAITCPVLPGNVSLDIGFPWPDLLQSAAIVALYEIRLDHLAGGDEQNYLSLLEQWRATYGAERDEAMLTLGFLPPKKDTR